MIRPLAVLECKFTTVEKSNSLSLAFLHSKSAEGLLDWGKGGGAVTWRKTWSLEVH